MKFGVKFIVLGYAVCSHVAVGRLLTKGEIKAKKSRRLHVGPHAPLVLPNEPSPSPSFAHIPENDNTVTSGVDADSKHDPKSIDGADSSGKKGEKTDLGGATETSLSPTMLPVDLVPSSLKPSTSKLSEGKVVGDPAPAPGVPVEPTPAPKRVSTKNGVVDAIEKAFEKVIDRISGAGEPLTRAPTVAVISPPTFYPSSINRLTNVHSAGFAPVTKTSYAASTPAPTPSLPPIGKFVLDKVAEDVATSAFPTPGGKGTPSKRKKSS